MGRSVLGLTSSILGVNSFLNKVHKPSS